jgi:hypothetical protein
MPHNVRNLSIMLDKELDPGAIPQDNTWYVDNLEANVPTLNDKSRSKIKLKIIVRQLKT